MADKTNTEVEETTDVATEKPVQEEASTKEETKTEKPVEDTPVSEDKEETIEVPEKFKKLVEEIEKMSVMELSELVKVFEKKFDVSASAVAVAGPSVDGAKEEEKSTADVELTAIGDSKISVIKAVKAALSLGLKEAKDLVDAAPSVLATGIKKEDADELAKKLTEAGATVVLK